MLGSQEIAEINTMTVEAGKMLKAFSQDPLYRKPQKKPDGSPVTKADLEVSAYLVERLEKWGFPVVSEEGALHMECQSSYFLVDPLDGTKHFVAGKKDYAVLIGFVENQIPTFGAIYSPEDQKLFSAQTGRGCFLNGKELRRKAPEAGVVAYSSGFHKKNIRKWVMESFSISEIKTRGSALKFCDIAEGSVDFFPRFGPTGEWDTAAAQVILQETNCSLIDMRTQMPITYGKPKRLNSGLVACHNSLLEKTKKFLKEYFEKIENGAK